MLWNGDFCNNRGRSEDASSGNSPGSVSQRTLEQIRTLEEICAKYSDTHNLSLNDLIALMRQFGLRPHPQFTQFAESRLYLLKEFHVQNDIEKFVASGITKETLTIALMAINLSPIFDNFLEALGDTRTRQRDRKLLLRPVPVLTRLANVMGDGVDTIPPSVFATPKFLASALESYATTLKLIDAVYPIIGANSISELTRYAFAGLIKRVTGHYHDREVSALTGAALQNFDYDETAHRVWRNRNYRRLETTASFAPLALQAANTILKHE